MFEYLRLSRLVGSGDLAEARPLNLRQRFDVGAVMVFGSFWVVPDTAAIGDCRSYHCCVDLSSSFK